MKKRSLSIGLLASFAIAAIYCVGFAIPSSLNWGFHFFGFLPVWMFIAFCIVTGLLLFRIEKGYNEGILDIPVNLMLNRPGVFLSIVCAVFIVLATLLRIKVPLLGDSFILLNNYEYTFRGDHVLHLYRSPLAFGYFYFFANLLQKPAFPEILDAFLTGEIILGIGVIICTFYTLTYLIENPRHRLIAFCFVLVLPYMQLFAGYAELYAVGLFFLSLFLLVSVLHLYSRAPFYLLPPVYFLLYLTNYLNILLLPALLYSAVMEYRRGKKWTMPVGLLLCGVIAVLALAIVGFDAGRFFQSRESGHWLSLGVESKDWFEAYGMFSPYHFLDLINLFLHLAPFASIMILFTLVRGTVKEWFNETSGWFISVLPLFFGFVGVVKFDLGFPTDWDVTAPYFYLLNIFAVLVFLRSTSPVNAKTLSLFTVVSLFTSLSWFLLNSTTTPVLDRMKTLQDRRITSPGGMYQSFFHIGMYYHHINQPGKLVEIWKEYTTDYPEDWHGFYNLAHAYNENTVIVDSLTERAYERWITLDPKRTTGKIEYANFLSGRGLMHYQQRKYSQADRQLRKAFEMNPFLSPAYNNLASLLLDQQLPDSALVYCRMAIERNPSYTTAYQNIANAYAQKTELDSALVYYQKALELDPAYIPAYENMSRVYYQKGDMAHAMDALRRAARLGSRGAQSVLNRSGQTW